MLSSTVVADATRHTAKAAKQVKALIFFIWKSSVSIQPPSEPRSSVDQITNNLEALRAFAGVLADRFGQAACDASLLALRTFFFPIVQHFADLFRKQVECPIVNLCRPTT